MPNRPRGALRHYTGFLAPSAATGLGLALERNRAQRMRRLAAATGARAALGSGRTRPRMRALQVAPGARLRFKDVPAPRPPGPDGAIVHPIAASTCDLDCPIALGATQFALPLHLGHECVAEVLAVGERVRSVKAGERVIVPFQINCGACPSCLAGHTGNCASVPPVSMYGMGLLAGHWGGAFSDQLAVPFAEAMLVPLPDGVAPVAAAGLADNVCDAYRHVAPHLPSLLEADSDAEVLIIGAVKASSLFPPSVPLYCAMIAQALGAGNVHVADARPSVREQAERLGCDVLHPRRLSRRPPAPLVIDVTVNRLGLALACTAPDGVCSSSGSFHRSARVPLLKMYGRNMTLHVGRTHARALIPQVLELLLDGRLHPESVVSTLAPIDDAPAALREHFLQRGVKAVLTA